MKKFRNLKKNYNRQIEYYKAKEILHDELMDIQVLNNRASDAPHDRSVGAGDLAAWRRPYIFS